MNTKRVIGIVLLGVLLISLLFAAFDGNGTFIESLFAYVPVAMLCGVLVLVVVARQKDVTLPTWLLPALVGGLLLRLVLGLVLYRALPVIGYDTEIQNAGYAFADAFARDVDAWQLVDNNITWPSLLTYAEGGDQYGGLLKFSAALYKAFSPTMHRPLLIVLVTASFSTLACYYTWRVARDVFDARIAAIAAGIMLLYPDAILLGASQMREPFIMAAIAWMFHGYGQLRGSGVRGALLPFLGGALLAVMISPPMLVLTLILVGGTWLVDPSKRVRLPWWAWALGLGGIIAALLITTRAWSSISGSPDANPIQLVWWWLTEGARYQMLVLEQKSGMVQVLFSLTPEWAHVPLATLYGLVQPFFPAAVMDNTAPWIWRFISIWRGAGWFALLPFLLYAPFAALRAGRLQGLAAYFAAAAWGLAVFVSYRAAGDQWDNPRYRTAFLLVYALVAGWSWMWARRNRSRWLRHTGAVVGGVTLLFLQWYGGRYLHSPSLDLFPTIALMAVFVLGYLLTAWWLERRRMTRA